MIKGRFSNSVINEWLLITLGDIIVACAVFFFLMPSHLAVSSVSGLAIVLSEATGVNVSVLTMGMNIFCLILAFAFLGKEFGGKTVYCSVLLPLAIWFFEKIFPNFQSIMGEQFLDLVCYLFVVSLGLAILFVRNASSGGLDIIAKLLNKYFRIELGTALSVAGVIIALSTVFVYDLRTVALSLIGTYLNGIVLDHFLFGFSVKKKISIISSKWEEIRDYILTELHSGATMYEVIGAYDYHKRKELVVIANKEEYRKLMVFIEKTDPKAFMTISNISEIMYTPKPGMKDKQDR